MGGDLSPKSNAELYFRNNFKGNLNSQISLFLQILKWQVTGD